MRIALIGDLHIYSMRVRAADLLGKRIIGQSNLWLNRHRAFDHDKLAPLIEHVLSLHPDLALCSGDVTTTALRDEFEDVVQFLAPLSNEVPCVIVPGNHDRYTFRSARTRRFEKIMDGLMPKAFPHMQDLEGPWKLLSLDSGRPQVFSSRGALGPVQLQAVEAQLGTLSQDDAVLVLCHYPVITPKKIHRAWSHALEDEKPLKRMLAGCPARIVFIHGHIHEPWYMPANGTGSAPFESINAGAPCMINRRFPNGQGFWEIHLPPGPHDPLGLIHHIPTENGGWKATREV